jgi:hypothetical protein
MMLSFRNGKYLEKALDRVLRKERSQEKNSLPPRVDSDHLP